MILNIYKPKHWTSFDVVAKTRSILKTKKVGHAGTLDPLAEGVLIVLTDKDTKRQSEFMKLSKEYQAEIGFGLKSPTYDLEGPVELKYSNILLTEFEERVPGIIKNYIGNIKQRVPPYSAVKVQGKRLYKRARLGDVQKEKLPIKEITIYYIENIGFRYQLLTAGNTDVEVPVMNCTVTCSSGTYIRSLAHDIGEDIGTGAVLVKLVRTRVGDYKLEDSLNMTELSLKG